MSSDDDEAAYGGGGNKAIAQGKRQCDGPSTSPFTNLSTTTTIQEGSADPASNRPRMVLAGPETTNITSTMRTITKIDSPIRSKGNDFENNGDVLTWGNGSAS
jgi:hypothetical protein